MLYNQCNLSLHYHRAFNRKMAENQAKTFLEEKGYWDLWKQQKKFEEILKLPTLPKLIEVWPTYENLKVIVVGSSSKKEGFISSGAFVGEVERGYDVPDSVLRFQMALDMAFPPKNKPKYDFVNLYENEEKKPPENVNEEEKDLE